jgi:uncharacterized protein
VSLAASRTADTTPAGTRCWRASSPRRRRLVSKAGRRATVALGIVSLLAACSADNERTTLEISTRAGAVIVDVEIADSVAERRRGLMGRTELPEREGMLFVYEQDSRRGFWMKATLIPLSIAFLDAGGRVLRILDMEPCTAEPCPVYDPGIAYRSALEVNQGAFDRLGVSLGDVATLSTQSDG